MFHEATQTDKVGGGGGGGGGGSGQIDTGMSTQTDKVGGEGGQIDTGMSTQTVGGGGQELVVLVWYLATTTILKLKNNKLYSFSSGTIQSPSSHKEGTA